MCQSSLFHRHNRSGFHPRNFHGKVSMYSRVIVKSSIFRTLTIPELVIYNLMTYGPYMISNYNATADSNLNVNGL